ASRRPWRSIPRTLVWSPSPAPEQGNPRDDAITTPPPPRRRRVTVTLCPPQDSGVYGVLRRKDALLTQGKKLVIVESPTKMRSIQGYLGDDYEVLSSVGHIRDLADKKDIPAADKEAYGKYSIDVEND